MNIVKRLTLRHIKTQKKRTVLTVLAIIVSTAMITAVFTGVYSFIQFQKSSALRYDGSWQAQFFYDKMPDLSVFEKENDMDYYAGCNIYTASYGDNPSVQIDAVTPGAVSLRNIKIKSGKFPSGENEILLTDTFIKDNSLKIKAGDKIKLRLENNYISNQSEKEFTVCGIAQGNIGFFEKRGGVVALTDKIPDNVPYYVTIRYKKPDNSFYEKTKRIIKSTNAEDRVTSYNTDILAYNGVIKGNSDVAAIALFLAIILAVIVIASVAMIYGSFSASYLERERYIGMLASVGATKRQKRSSVYFEGFVLGCIGIPLGVIFGCLGMEITFRAIRSEVLKVFTTAQKNEFKVYLSPYILLFSVLLGAVTIFISCLVPAKKASKTSPLAAIKNSGNIKIKNAKRIKTPKIVSRLFGFEGELAVKNFKRNKKQSRNIILAFTISAVLFVSVANFSQMFTSLVKKNYGETAPDFTITTETKNLSEVEKYLEVSNIGKSFTCIMNDSAGIKNSDVFTSEAKETAGIDASDKTYYENAEIFFMDDKDFDAYLKTLGENPKNYHGRNIPVAILFNNITVYSGSKPKNVPAFNKNVKGKTLDGFYDVENGGEDGGVTQIPFSFKVGTVTVKEYPSSMFEAAQDTRPSIIFPLSIYSSFSTDGYATTGIYTKDYSREMKNAVKYFESKGVDVTVRDEGAAIRTTNAYLSIMKVFVYGFITLISLIAAFNIINSITGSMNERAREFAMLKSVGVTPRGFSKMIFVENFRYGLLSLLISIPVNIAIQLFMNYALSNSEGTEIPFSPNVRYYLIAAAAMFGLILISILLSGVKNKSRYGDIVQNLKDD